jgi:hypothetical protein
MIQPRHLAPEDCVSLYLSPKLTCAPTAAQALQKEAAADDAQILDSKLTCLGCLCMRYRCISYASSRRMISPGLIKLPSSIHAVSSDVQVRLAFLARCWRSGSGYLCKKQSTTRCLFRRRKISRNSLVANRWLLLQGLPQYIGRGGPIMRYRCSGRQYLGLQ